MSTHLETLLYDQPWALLRSKLDTMTRVTMERRLTDSEVLEKLSALEQRAAAPVLSRGGTVAVLPVYGLISQRASIFSLLFGGVSLEGLSRAFQQTLADPNVGVVVFDFDSPGGAVSGVPEMAAEIYAARSRKKIVAISNTMAASAAYWLASQASELIVTPSGQVGSIGVYTIHTDFSKMNEKIGATPEYVFAGKYKVEGNPDAPLSATARQYLQSQVDDYYRMFVNAEIGRAHV